MIGFFRKLYLKRFPYWTVINAQENIIRVDHGYWKDVIITVENVVQNANQDFNIIYRVESGYTAERFSKKDFNRFLQKLISDMVLVF